MQQESLNEKGIAIIDESIDLSVLKEPIDDHHTRVIGMAEFKGDIFKD